MENSCQCFPVRVFHNWKRLCFLRKFCEKKKKINENERKIAKWKVKFEKWSKNERFQLFGNANRQLPRTLQKKCFQGHGRWLGVIFLLQQPKVSTQLKLPGPGLLWWVFATQFQLKFPKYWFVENNLKSCKPPTISKRTFYERTVGKKQKPPLKLEFLGHCPVCDLGLPCTLQLLKFHTNNKCNVFQGVTFLSIQGNGEVKVICQLVSSLIQSFVVLRVKSFSRWILKSSAVSFCLDFASRTWR